MQVLVSYDGSPEDYLATSAERQMLPPHACPNCGSLRRLRFHGYYSRFVSSRSNGEALLVNIRRYRCRDCLLTTSLLPWFCLSYRLVRAESVARFLRGDGIDACDLRWQGLLSRCRRRFESWIPQLVDPLESLFGVGLRGTIVPVAWRAVEIRLGSIGEATRAILTAAGMTFLGRYLCHRSPLGSFRQKDDHTNLLFSSGTDPPT